MLIFPAIDLLDGKVVRLFQGDYEQQETYGDNPAAFAAKFAFFGATHLHVVDLDGAKHGARRNFDQVKNILAAAPLFVELGGGIRDDATVYQCLEAGVGRVILGTSALKDPAFTRRMVAEYGDKIAVGVDARDGRVAVEGWCDTTEVDSIEFCKEMRDIGVSYIIYTDISRDGAGRGANLAVYEKLNEIEGVHFSASGGVSSLLDIESLRDRGLYATVLGKALYRYEGGLKLEDAIRAAAGPMQ